MRWRSRKRRTDSNSLGKLILFRPRSFLRRMTPCGRTSGWSKDVNGELAMIRITIRKMQLWLRTILPIRTWSFSMSNAFFRGQTTRARWRMISWRNKEMSKSETYVRHISAKQRRRRSVKGPLWKIENKQNTRWQKTIAKDKTTNIKVPYFIK